MIDPAEFHATPLHNRMVLLANEGEHLVGVCKPDAPRHYMLYTLHGHYVLVVYCATTDRVTSVVIKNDFELLAFMAQNVNINPLFPPPMTNKTTLKVKKLEKAMLRLKDEEFAAGDMTLYASTLEELREFCDAFKLHLYSPFEKDAQQNYYYCDYHLPELSRVLIKVESSERYRMDCNIIEI